MDLFDEVDSQRMGRQQFSRDAAETNAETVALAVA